MLLLSLLLLAAAILAFVRVPEFLIHSRYPLPVYGLLLASVVAAFASRRRGVWRSLTIGGTALLGTLFVAYTALYYEIGDGRLSIRAGDRFPEFTVQTSTGGSFSPSQLRGKSAALYIFYRGHW
jgi:hypothetical protein